MRTPVLAAMLAVGLLAAPLATFAQPAPTNGGVPPSALDDFHAQTAKLKADIRSGVTHKTVEDKSGDHALVEIKRMENDEAQWERRQAGRVYPNQLADLNKRLDVIHGWLDKQQPPHS